MSVPLLRAGDDDDSRPADLGKSPVLSTCASEGSAVREHGHLRRGWRAGGGTSAGGGSGGARREDVAQREAGARTDAVGQLGEERWCVRE